MEGGEGGTISLAHPTRATRAYRKFIQMKFDSEVTTGKKIRKRRERKKKKRERKRNKRRKETK